MTSRRGIGVFGGTFDPIHIGHLAAAEDARAQLDLQKILFIPNNVPPHKRDQRVSIAGDRVRMVELAIADNTGFELCTIELERPGPSYTLDTLRLLRSRLGSDVHLTFLTGCDSLLFLHTWHQPDALLAEFELVFLARPTDDPIDWERIEARFPEIRKQTRTIQIPLLEISAQELRRRVRAGLPIRYYVTAPVEAYIREHALYR
jgi:nicotinate-nucleotide adenylyltransferase